MHIKLANCRRSSSTGIDAKSATAARVRDADLIRRLGITGVRRAVIRLDDLVRRAAALLECGYAGRDAAEVLRQQDA
jgi:hypothetical protein